MNKVKLFNFTTVPSILFAFFVWGAWAFYANKDSENALQSFFVQGFYSGTMTLYFSFCIYNLINKFDTKLMKYFFPAFLTVAHTGIILILAHKLNQTQNLILTVVPPLIVGYLYCQFLVYQQLNKKNEI